MRGFRLRPSSKHKPPLSSSLTSSLTSSAAHIIVLTTPQGKAQFFYRYRGLNSVVDSWHQKEALRILSYIVYRSNGRSPCCASLPWRSGGLFQLSSVVSSLLRSAGRAKLSAPVEHALTMTFCKTSSTGAPLLNGGSFTVCASLNHVSRTPLVMLVVAFIVINGLYVYRENDCLCAV